MFDVLSLRDDENNGWCSEGLVGNVQYCSFKSQLTVIFSHFLVEGKRPPQIMLHAHSFSKQSRFIFVRRRVQ